MRIVSIHLNEMKGASLGQEHLQEAITSPAERIKQTKKKKRKQQTDKTQSSWDDSDQGASHWILHAASQTFPP